MITREFLSGSSTNLMLVIGSPSTRRKSASAPSSTTPSFPRYGLRGPESANSSASSAVAIVPQPFRRRSPSLGRTPDPPDRAHGIAAQQHVSCCFACGEIRETNFAGHHCELRHAVEHHVY